MSNLQSVDERTARELRGLARVLVRSGYADHAAITAALTEAVREDAPAMDAAALVPLLIGEAVMDLNEDAAAWPRVHGSGPAGRRTGGIRVVSAWSWFATRRTTTRLGTRLESADSPQGLVFFTDTDVWHAVDFGMLELKLWHPDTANVAPGEPLLEDVLALLRQNDLPAVFDEGRIEVTVDWQRRVTL